MSATDQQTAPRQAASISEDELHGKATPDEQAATAAAREVSTAVERADFTLPARHDWDSSQVAVIRRTVAKDCNANELAMFLEVAARYQLDPFTREIFAAKFNGSDGPVTIFAGRDGLLKAAKIAKGSKLRHMESHVVRAKDTYEVEVDTSTATDEGVAKIRTLVHKRSGMGSEARGPIVGAYALVWMQGEEAPWFAEATWEDYGAKKAQSSKSNWKTDGSGYTEAMMIKVPQSIALRMACGLAGLYSQEEVQKQLDDQSGQNLSGGGDPTATTPGVEWPDSEMGLTLQALVARANELQRGSWRPAKVAMRVNARTEAELEELARELRTFIAKRVPHDPLVEGEPVDAVVVDDDGVVVGEAKATEMPAEDPPLQGPVSQPVIDAAHDNEQARVLLQERLEQLHEYYNRGAISDLGFDSDPEVTAEIDRLEAALRVATNGGETVAEAIEQEEPEEEVTGTVEPEEEDEPEEPIEWGELAEAELADLTDLLPQLKDELDQAEEGTEAKRVLQNNYDEAAARLKALEAARDGAGPAEAK